MLGKIMPAVDGTSTAEGEARNSSNGDFVNRAAVKNVELTIANLKSMSPVLNEMLENGEIDVVGAMYDVKDGSVSFL
jgi:carbonic anhydrase